jgi:hypothetical protein
MTDTATDSVSSAAYREIVRMVEGRRSPGIRGMTGFTIRRKLSRLMCRVFGVVVVRSMAVVTSFWGIRINSFMTGSAIFRNGSMSSGQGKISAVIWE